LTVLVDTSVWSLALPKKGPVDHPAVKRLASFLEANESLVLTGLILQEVLQAFRSDASFRTVARHLEAFPILPLERADFVRAAELHRRCAARGIAASTVDCQIAISAMRHDCGLLTADTDFERIASLSDLSLV
jgi:predicted nucleic acid-binding protein